jgi:8-hydroxy-5-deazaflavin:NADPH oxidoreductase
MAETPERAGWLLPYAKARAILRERYWRSLWIRARIIDRFTSDYGRLKRLGDNNMKIGIIGAGKVGGGLGKLWVRAGYQVLFSSRHPKRLRVLVEEAGLGAYLGDVRDAALFGDVILFSPNFWGVDDALKAAGPLKGRTVIDVTNPVEWNPNGRMTRALPQSTSAGEELAKKLPNARVVKAFTTIPASFIPHAIYRTGQLQRLAVFYCGDHQTSKVIVHQLIADSGFVGLDAGRLRMARELEVPGRISRSGLIGIAQAKRLLDQLTDSIQNKSLASNTADQSAFIDEESAIANYI